MFLATTSKISAGETLNSASYMIFIDCTWTKAENLQCEDRIHRIGSRATIIYYLWCNNTIDEGIKGVVQNKSDLSDYIIDNKPSESLNRKISNILYSL